jgi:hypothetical protein
MYYGINFFMVTVSATFFSGPVADSEDARMRPLRVSARQNAVQLDFSL